MITKRGEAGDDDGDDEIGQRESRRHPTGTVTSEAAICHVIDDHPDHHVESPDQSVTQVPLSPAVTLLHLFYHLERPFVMSSSPGAGPSRPRQSSSSTSLTGSSHTIDEPQGDLTPHDVVHSDQTNDEPDDRESWRQHPEDHGRAGAPASVDRRGEDGSENENLNDEDDQGEDDMDEEDEEEPYVP